MIVSGIDFGRRFARVIFVVSMITWGSVHAAVFESYPEFQSKIFRDAAEFRSFFLERAVVKDVVWPQMSARSYVVSIDFTLDGAGRVSLLEINGPAYNYSSSSLSRSLENRIFRSLYMFFVRGSGGSGFSGHDSLFDGVTLDSMIRDSAAAFVRPTDRKLIELRDLDDVEYLKYRDFKSGDAILPTGQALEALSWAQIPKEAMTMNHPAIVSLASYKPLLSILSPVPNIVIPTTYFRRRDFIPYRSGIADFAQGLEDKYFILKPADQARSEGVIMVSRGALLSPVPIVADVLGGFPAKKFDSWVLQPYRPSAAALDSSGKYRNPVGRIFYQIISDGRRLQISPLTAYKKINSFASENPDDVYSPAKISFGPLEEAMEFSETELEIVISGFNHYFEQTSQEIFEMVEFGLERDNPIAQAMRDRYDRMSPYEKAALEKPILPYIQLQRDGALVPRRDAWGHRKYVRKGAGLDSLRNPVYDSLQRIRAQQQTQGCRQLLR